MDAATQLALEVDPAVALVVTEQRGGDIRELRLPPLPEPEARCLAAFLLNRTAEPQDDGPWRLAVAGGARTVRLEAP